MVAWVLTLLRSADEVGRQQFSRFRGAFQSQGAIGWP